MFKHTYCHFRACFNSSYWVRPSRELTWCQGNQHM